MKTKICSKCGLEKPIDEFPKKGLQCKKCKADYLKALRKSDPEGFKKKRRKHRQANRDKINAQKRDWYAKNPDRIKDATNRYYHDNADKMKKWQREYQERTETASMDSWLAKCMKHSKAGDKRLGREFNLDLDFLKDLFLNQGGRCALSNLPMVNKRHNLFAASIDRIDPKQGHIKGNVQLVCSAMNLAKREHSNEEMLIFLDAYRNTNIIVPEFDGFNFPESTYHYTPCRKRAVIGKLHKICTEFVPPTYSARILDDDWNRVKGAREADYLTDRDATGVGWRAHKPESQAFAGKRLIWHFHPHMWDVKTLGKLTIKEVWGKTDLFTKAANNLVNGRTRISFDRIIRELIFVGAGVASQMHPGFAKAVLSHYASSATTVFDPFAGWGARMMAAAALDMAYIGYELSNLTYGGLEEMVGFIGGNNTLVHIDSLRAEFPKADALITSPPFGTEEYIGSDCSVDLNAIIAKSSHIPVRVFHINKNLLDFFKDFDIVEVNTRSAVGDNKTVEYLAVSRRQNDHHH